DFHGNNVLYLLYKERNKLIPDIKFIDWEYSLDIDRCIKILRMNYKKEFGKYGDKIKENFFIGMKINDILKLSGFKYLETEFNGVKFDEINMDKFSEICENSKIYAIDNISYALYIDKIFSNKRLFHYADKHPPYNKLVIYDNYFKELKKKKNYAKTDIIFLYLYYSIINNI